jgi:hypothetical protein
MVGRQRTFSSKVHAWIALIMSTIRRLKTNSAAEGKKKLFGDSLIGWQDFRKKI